MARKNAVALKIKQARKQLGFSQTEVSTRAGLQRCQISDLERGVLNLDHVHFGTIRKLSEVLALTPNDFVENAVLTP